MTTETKRPGAHQFVALEIALEIVAALRDAAGVVRRHDVDLARQIVRSASSIAANVGEGRSSLSGRGRVRRERNTVPEARGGGWGLVVGGGGCPANRRH